MCQRLAIPAEKMSIVKLGIDPVGFEESMPRKQLSGSKQIGYLARLSPEKGFHVLVDAFILLREKRDDVQLRIAGWLGTEHKSFAEEQFEKLRNAGLGDAYSYSGIVDRQEKLEFLAGLDVFTVPTTYREPKGRFALEAMACGLPVVLPDHGAFPELIAETQCGVLVRPNDPQHLAAELDLLLDDPDRCGNLGASGKNAIHDGRTALAMAQQMFELYTKLCTGEKT
jgi:glycosyltransferase involved in cell wall biosynthesis